MNEIDITPENSNAPGEGFRVSAQPVVRSREPESPAPAAVATNGLGELPDSYDADLLYVVARDPKSLFLYWEIDWTGLFAAAELSPREVHLRILREDGTEESTTEVDPAAVYFFAYVADSGARYSCELGCFADSEWKALVRSNAAATPGAAMSDDLEADFATLPFHLSFQRLIDIFRAPRAEPKTLAKSVAGMQKKTRALRKTMPAADWSKLVETAVTLVNAEATFGMSEVRPEDFSALLLADQIEPDQPAPSPEMRERWRELGERFGGSSWSGFGGSSPA